MGHSTVYCAASRLPIYGGTPVYAFAVYNQGEGDEWHTRSPAIRAVYDDYMGIDPVLDDPVDHALYRCLLDVLRTDMQDTPATEYRPAVTRDAPDAGLFKRMVAGDVNTRRLPVAIKYPRGLLPHKEGECEEMRKTTVSLNNHYLQYEEEGKGERFSLSVCLIRVDVWDVILTLLTERNPFWWNKVGTLPHVRAKNLAAVQEVMAMMEERKNPDLPWERKFEIERRLDNPLSPLGRDFPFYADRHELYNAGFNYHVRHLINAGALTPEVCDRLTDHWYVLLYMSLNARNPEPMLRGPQDPDWAEHVAYNRLMLTVAETEGQNRKRWWEERASKAASMAASDPAPTAPITPEE